jgi:hypothetical protein
MQIEPAVIPLQALGIIDVGGSEISNNEVIAHALANSACDHSDEFVVRWGSTFVSEYPRLNTQDSPTRHRTHGGYDDPNHMLGAFPVLFPYGMGGLEVDRVL